MDDVRTKKEYQHKPFIIAELEDLPGGGSLKLGDLDKSKKVIPPGFFVGKNADGMLVLLVSAVLVEAAVDTAKTLKVKKGSQLQVGKFIAGDEEGSKAYAVTKIDTANADYDEVTIGTALGVALDAGDSVYEVKAEDATGGEGELPVIPIGLGKNEIDLSKNHAETGVSVRGSYTVATMAFGAPKAYTKHLPLMRFKYPNK
ncbi:MAG: hypothetical protein GX102_04615 [Porphyromonadaceae bacterium]|nr:hypothetical protein [Porphyromonadaceae bacterium]